MRHLAYVAMLAFCLVGTLPLEVVLRLGVYRQLGRLALTLAPVLAVFVAWDLYAIARGHWQFDPQQTVGVVLPGGLPLEELAFFIVIPVVAVLTFEAVRAISGWRIGDEPA